MRSRIRRGLLKVEQLHALARDVFYGRRGRINARELWEQMNTCSCLNLILACIVYWQAREISRVLSQCDPLANGVDTSLLLHVSPSSGITSCFTVSISSIGSSSGYWVGGCPVANRLPESRCVRRHRSNDRQGFLVPARVTSARKQ